MSSVCISNCLNDAVRIIDPRHSPVRATYVNLYKWPESDAEFVRSVTSRGTASRSGGHARVVDSISCRQMYFRSYPFTRDEAEGGGDDDEGDATKCFGRERKKKASKSGGLGRKRRSKRCGMLRRVKELSCSAVSGIFHRLLSCAATVDVVDQEYKT